MTLEDEFSDEELNALINDMDTASLLDKIKTSQIEAIKKATAESMRINDVYQTISEKDFLEVTINSDHSIVHFFDPTFTRCALLDKHIVKLAIKYDEVTFLKIDANSSKFFCDKLNVRVLPTLISFKNGVRGSALIGFDGLSSDEFSTRELEKVLIDRGMLPFEKKLGVYTAK